MKKETSEKTKADKSQNIDTEPKKKWTKPKLNKLDTSDTEGGANAAPVDMGNRS